MLKKFTFNPGDSWNPWLVKGARRCLHERFWLAPASLLLYQIVAFAFLAIERHRTESDWNSWTVALLLLVVGSGAGFSLSRFDFHSTRKGCSLRDFYDFAPLDPRSLITGALLLYLLTTGILILTVLPLAVSTLLVTGDGKITAWFTLLYLGGFFLQMMYCQRRIRSEMTAIAGYLVIFVLFVWSVEEMFYQNYRYYLLQFALLNGYGLVIAFNAPRAQSRERETWPRLAQLALLGVAALFYFYLPDQTFLWIIPLAVAFLGSLESIGGVFYQRYPAGKPGIPAFFLAGYSSGGWLLTWVAGAAAWLMLRKFEDLPLLFRDLPLILLFTSQLASLGFRLFRKSAAAERWIMLWCCGLAMLLDLLYGFAVEFLYAREWGTVFWWAMAGLLLLLQLPFIGRDFLRCLTGKKTT